MHESPVTVRLFGSLHALYQKRGMPTVVEVTVPGAGMSGAELADLLDLPAEEIEGIFCNHTVRPLSHTVYPGDAVAFVPPGTPGPHRYFLGLYKAGKDTEAPSHGMNEESDKRY